jgi:hypothetical protein
LFGPLAVAVTAGGISPAPGLAAPAPAPVVFYVSPSGDDGWSGRLPAPNARRTNGPFGSLGRALDAVRQARAQVGLARPVTVLLRDGRHFLAAPLTLTPEHSGGPAAPTTIAAYPGERPVLSGGRLTTGWHPDRDGLWAAKVPDVAAGRWYFRQLFVNGERRRRARLPAQGTYALAGGASPEASAFVYAPGDISEGWANRADIEVVVLQYWTEARLRIADLDPASRTVRFTGGSWRPLTWSMGYYVENVAEALGAPGEWYLDKPTGVVRYKPLPGEDMAKAEVIAPAAEALLRLQGDPDRGRYIRHVVLRGLTFAHCAWPLPPEGLAYPQAELAVGAAVEAWGACDCAVEDCEIAHTDTWGIGLSRGSRGWAITGCYLHDLGAGGVKVGEYEVPKRPEHEAGWTTIADCILRDGAQSYFGGPAVWIGQSGHNTIAHNEISGSWQWAASVGWNWGYASNPARDNVVEYNHVHHIATALGSHSSIYTLGIQPGTVIRRNIVHHGAGYGIGLDQASSGVLVENNLVYRNAAGLHFNWDCLGDIVQNNVFALNGPAQWTRYGDAPRGDDMNSNIIQRNIVYWRDGRLWVEPGWPNFRMVLDSNLYFDASGAPVTFFGATLDQWRTKGLCLDQNSVIADPLFMNPDADDYRLRPDSPAFALGFRELDLRGVGPRRKPPHAP